MLRLKLTSRSLYPPDVVHTRHAGTQPAVHTEDLGRDDGCDGEGVEDVDERLPGLDVGSAFAFVVETVDCERGEQREPLAPTFLSDPSPNLPSSSSSLFTSLTPRNIRALMVPPQQEEVLRVLDLVAQQQQDRLEGLLPPVDVVPEEEVVGRGGGKPHISKRRMRSAYCVGVGRGMGVRLVGS